MSDHASRLAKRRCCLALFVISFVCTQLVNTQPVGADAPTGDYIVLFSQNADLHTKIAKEARLGNAISDVYNHAANGFVAELDATDVRRLKADKDVLVVEPDRVIQLEQVDDTTTTTLPSTSATSSSGINQQDLAGTFIVSLRDDVLVQEFVATESGLGVNAIEAYSQAINGYVALLNESQIDRLSKDPRVVSVEPNTIVELDGDQASPPWGLDRIDQRNLPLDSTYTFRFGGVGVKAYVIDTGIRADHREFSGRVASGFTTISDAYGTSDCNGHGTHVAGTIGGSTYGVAKSVALVPIRVLSCAGSGWLSNVVSGINWMITDHPSGSPAVANMSLGSTYNSTLNTAVANAVNDGINMVVAAGNSNRSACSYSPASAALAITVGSTTSTDARSSFSNYGSCVDIFAPGSSITSAYHTSSTATRSLSGTSMAAPHVAGTVALFLEAEPSLAPADVVAKLATYATPDLVTSPGAGSVNLLLYTRSAWLAPDPLPPSPPRSLTGVAGIGVVSLAWLAPTTDNGGVVTDYLVEYSLDSGGAWSVFNDGVSTLTTATVTGLSDAQAHQFRVKAINRAGSSDASATITVLPGIPSSPTSLVAVGLDTTVRLTWLAPSVQGSSAISDYQVEFSTNPESGFAVFNDGISTNLTATVTGLTNGTTYYFIVKAINSIGLGQASSVVTGVPWAIAVPSAPRDVVVASVALTAVGLTWTAPASDGGSTVIDYLIEHSANSGVTWSTYVDTVTAQRSVTVTGLTNGTAYLFRVSAINIAGTGAVSSSTSPAAPGIASEPVEVGGLGVGPRRAMIHWDRPLSNGGSEIIGYVVEYSIDSGTNWITWAFPTTVVGCSCPTISRTITGLTDGVPHIFRVKAQNAIGIGLPSESTEAMTPLTPVVPGIPRNISVVVRTGQVDLDWDEPLTDGGALVTDYEIQYSTDQGSSWSTISDGVRATTFLTIRTLVSDTSHIFRISAINEVGSGSWSDSTAPITTISPLTNDPFAGATLLSLVNGNTFNSSTITATRELDEPKHGGYSPSASIWYKWVAQEPGTLVLTTLGSDFDTLLGVYTGLSVNQLTTVVVNDDAAGEQGLWSRVSVAVTAGQTYAIAVDGYSNQKGATRLNLTYTPAPPPTVPDAPQQVRASPGNAIVTLNWLTPNSDGNSSIISYTATATPGEKNCTSSGALSCVVRGLTNGVSYSFTVTATNAIGTSVASTATSGVTPSVDADRGVTALSWGLDRIDQRNLPLNTRYANDFSGGGVNVYVIDTGILTAHSELVGRVSAGFSTIIDGRGTQDCNGHGTHVAGTIGGTNYGVATNATLVPVRILDCAGSGSTSGIIAGIDWLVEHHTQGVPAVANMSLGGFRSFAINTAVARGVADGVVFVVAAGNSNSNACDFSPASERLAITVGSTTSSDVRSSFSNAGTCLDLFAPGSNIKSAWYSSNTATNTISGTSMASPHVAGVAALALSAHPNLTVDQVSTWITSSATQNVVTDIGSGSPNLFLYSLLSAAPPASVVENVPTTTTTTTTIVPIDGGGGSGGGDDGDGGSQPAPETPRPTMSTVAPTTSTVPMSVPPNVVPIVSPTSYRQALGQVIHPITANTPSVPTVGHANAGNVLFKVRAKPGATVNVYRNGILVSSVPASAAEAIKIADNPVGVNSFQIVVVDRSGKVSASDKKFFSTTKPAKTKTPQPNKTKITTSKASK